MSSLEDSKKMWQHVQQNVSQIKDMKLESKLNIFTDDEKISYLGNNIWTYANAKDITVKVFSTENMEYPSSPYIAITPLLKILQEVNQHIKLCYYQNH